MFKKIPRFTQCEIHSQYYTVLAINVCCYSGKQECFTGKYSTHRIYIRPHLGLVWRIFHILTSLSGEDLIISLIACLTWWVSNAGHGSLFYQYWNNLKPLLILTLSLSIALVQYLGLKGCLSVVLRPKGRGQSYSSIGKTMTRDLCFRPAAFSVTRIGDIFVHLSTCHLSTYYLNG